MTNLLARRSGAQDQIIPQSFRDKYRSYGFKVGTAPEGLPLVEEPTMLADLEPAKETPAPELELVSAQFRCGVCSRLFKTSSGMKSHLRAKHA